MSGLDSMISKGLADMPRDVKNLAGRALMTCSEPTLQVLDSARHGIFADHWWSRERLYGTLRFFSGYCVPYRGLA
jgi:hypothetical protein